MPNEQQQAEQQQQQQGGNRYTAEQAFQIINENQINPQHIAIIMDILMNTPEGELSKLFQALEGEGGGEQQAAEGQQQVAEEEEGEYRF